MAFFSFVFEMVGEDGQCLALLPLMEKIKAIG
jgi:hypothetical protein